eukprot:5453803-Amphidinium_carterae.2
MECKASTSASQVAEIGLSMPLEEDRDTLSASEVWLPRLRLCLTMCTFAVCWIVHSCRQTAKRDKDMGNTANAANSAILRRRRAMQPFGGRSLWEAQNERVSLRHLPPYPRESVAQRVCHRTASTTHFITFEQDAALQQRRSVVCEVVCLRRYMMQ